MLKIAVVLFAYVWFSLSVTQAPTPLPEPTRVFTCEQPDRDYYPTDIAFGPDGTLYSSDAQLPLRSSLYSKPDLDLPADYLAYGLVYTHREADCVAVFGRDEKVDVFGLSEHEGSVCVAWRIDQNPTLFEQNEDLLARVSCITQDGRAELIYTSESPAAMLGDLDSSGESLWLSFRPMNFTMRVGTLGFVVNVTEDQTIPIESIPVHFLAAGGERISSLFPLPENDAFYTAASLLIDNTPITLDTVFPSGVLKLQDHILVGDYRTGYLHLLNKKGKPLALFTGLAGPMGMALSPEGEICIAEMLGDRVSCYDTETLLE